MDDFILYPLQLLMNRENIVTRLQSVEELVGAVPSARVGALGEMSQQTGTLMVNELLVINHNTGLPDVYLDQFGLRFANQEGDITFEDTDGGRTIAVYSDGDNNLILANSYGGSGVGIYTDDASHNVSQFFFDGDGNLTIPGNYQLEGRGTLGTVATNANDIFRCNSCATSAFAGTINGTPSGSTLVYTPVSGNENVLVPASTSQLAKMRLYNTSRGEHLLISNTNTGTNTITFTSAVPVGWSNGETIEITSQTVSGGGFSWVDLELTSGDFVDKTSVFLYLVMIDSGGAGQALIPHPFEAYAVGNLISTAQTQSTQPMIVTHPYKLTDNIISVAWTASGAATATVIIRQSMYIY